MDRGYLGLGDYQLCKEFSHHSLDMEQWRTMTKDQQTTFITEMKTWSVKRLLQSRKVATVEVTGLWFYLVKHILENLFHNLVIPFCLLVSLSRILVNLFCILVFCVLCTVLFLLHIETMCNKSISQHHIYIFRKKPFIPKES